MKIFPANIIRQLDAATIEENNIKSFDLMEKAASVFTDFFTKKISRNHKIKVFCGVGNNGGDGLAVSRMLLNKKYKVTTYILPISNSFSSDFTQNLEKLTQLNSSKIVNVSSENDFEINTDDIVIDAIFGTGITRPVQGIAKKTIVKINKSRAKVFSIDLPSGLSCDTYTDGEKIMAHHTLSFELPKLSLFMPENDKFIGKWKAKSIGLSENFINNTPTDYYFFTKKDAKTLVRKRSKFSHKGSNGHALIVAGSKGYYGAATLSTKACIYSGAGLTTTHIPSNGTPIIHSSVPEAIVFADENPDVISKIIIPDKVNALGIGPGIGKSSTTLKAFENLLQTVNFPLVIDADALNLLAENSSLLKKLPKNSVLTPHPGEFERLAGKLTNDYERLTKQIRFSKKHKVIVVLKGAHTSTSTPQGKVYFNSTGNPSLATGGSGDVLTGIITGLMAQHYSPIDAALLGVYIHGLCADIYQKKTKSERITASQIIENIHESFESLLY